MNPANVGKLGQVVAGAVGFRSDLDLMLDAVGRRGVVVFTVGHVGSADSALGYLLQIFFSTPVGLSPMAISSM